MLYSQVTDFMRARAEQIMAGRLRQVAETHMLPLPVDLGTARFIVRSAEEGCQMLTLMREALLKRGVTGLRPQVKAVDLPRAGRFRAWVDWHEISASAETGRVCAALYFMRNGPCGLQVQMISYSDLLLPELNPQFARIAIPA